MITLLIMRLALAAVVRNPYDHWSIQIVVLALLLNYCKSQTDPAVQRLDHVKRAQYELAY
jgi:hypothetical protein